MEKTKEQIFREQIAESKEIIKTEINKQLNCIVLAVLTTILVIYASYVIGWFMLPALIVNAIFYRKFQKSKMIYDVETVVLSMLENGQKLFCD